MWLRNSAAVMVVGSRGNVLMWKAEKQEKELVINK